MGEYISSKGNQVKTQGGTEMNHESEHGLFGSDGSNNTKTKKGEVSMKNGDEKMGDIYFSAWRGGNITKSPRTGRGRARR